MSVLLFNKPYDVLCQFTDSSPVVSTTAPARIRRTLADYIEQPDYYAAGRLDRDSEGLLLLTNDGKLQHRISHPRHKLPKTYCVQIEGTIDDQAIARLRTGVLLKDGTTAPALAEQVPEPAWLWPRTPPIRERLSIPTSWICITLSEGKNRQIRRMTAAVGFPALRLIRTRIGPWSIDGLASGQWEFSQTRI